MIPVHSFTPLLGLDSHFLQLPGLSEPNSPDDVESVQAEVATGPLQVVAPPVGYAQKTSLPQISVSRRARIPAPVMRWSARPAQAIGMLSDNACAACPHA